jgi:hypothetical protein
LNSIGEVEDDENGGGRGVDEGEEVTVSTLIALAWTFKGDRGGLHSSVVKSCSIFSPLFFTETPSWLGKKL